MRNKNIKNILRYSAGLTIVAALLIQIVLIIIHWDTPQGSDMAYYIAYAKGCVDLNSWYPSASNLYDPYLFAPGLVNLLILCIKVLGSWKAAMILNVLFNLIIIFGVYALGKKFFNINIAYIGVILWNLLYSNWYIVVPVGTELPFLALSLASLCIIVYRNKQILSYILAGGLLILANYVRPLAVLFLIIIVLYMILHKSKWVDYIALIIPIIVGAWMIGTMTEKNTGIFAFQSSTSGVNLAMSANDKAYGGVATHLFSDTTNLCYIKDKSSFTFSEKDSIYKARALKWISENPGKYVMLFPKKIGGLWIEDSWVDRPILGGDGFVGKVASGGGDKSALIKRLIHMALGSIVYYFVIIIGVLGIIRNFRLILKNYSTQGLLLLYLLMGVGATCIFCVAPRYHYPMMFVMVLFAAQWLENEWIRE